MRCFSFCLLAVLACAGSRIEVDLGSVPPALEVHAIAVWPFTFTHKYEPYESYEKTHDIVQAMLARKRYVILAGDDFEVSNSRGDHPFLASDLALRTTRLAILPRRLAVIRAHAEERIASHSRELVDKRGRVVGIRKEYDKSIVVGVSILHPDSGARLLSTRTVVPVDLFAMKQPYDPRPEVTKALKRTLEAALDRLSQIAQSPTWRRAAVALRVNPRPVFTYAMDNHDALTKKLANLNFVEADVIKFTRYQYFYPALTPRDFSLFERHPHGLVVDGVSDDSFRGAGLQKGDVILRMGEAEMLGENRFRRAVALAKAGDRVALRVSRAGKIIDLTWVAK
ncbi:MAG: PDZ domain-containing protein [Deltaproteobacteria bacterium]|nr:PDZ domain-containing protein [Deltaproteobacteria bacterium]